MEKINSTAFLVPWIVIASLILPPTESITEQRIIPGPRHLEAVAYDPIHEKLVLMGGIELNAQGFSEPSETYEFSKGEWTRYFSTPGSRRGHAMIFDSETNSILCLGGVVQHSNNDSVLFDLWKWNDLKWTLLNSTCPVKEPRAVCDEAGKRLLVYGDANNPREPWSSGQKRSWELWEFKSATWKRLSTTGPAEIQKLVYDTKAGSTLTLEWTAEKIPVIWEWTNSQWKKHASISTGPKPRDKFGIAYNPSDHALYLFGGRDEDGNFLNDLWRWNGEWQQIENKERPSPRASVQLVSAKDGLLLYGGSRQSGGLTNELWHWNREWKKIQ